MAEANAGGQGNTETPEQKAAAAAAATAAAAAVKTPEQLAADTAAATAAAAAAAAAKGDNKGGTVADPPKAPEKTDLKLPEGDLAIYVDDKVVDRILSIAKTNGWTKEETQEQLDSYASSYKAQADEFRAMLTADPEYGGDKLAETQRLARAVLEKVRPADSPRGKALRRILDQSGYGNHPEIVSFLADIGKATGEDKQVGGGGSGGSGDQKKDPATVLYGS